MKILVGWFALAITLGSASASAALVTFDLLG